MSYALGGHILDAAQADRDLGWTKSKLKKYWDQRAQACQQFADEGECLAQVAKHVPVTIGGLGLPFRASGTIMRAPVTARTISRTSAPVMNSSLVAARPMSMATPRHRSPYTAAAPMPSPQPRGRRRRRRRPPRRRRRSTRRRQRYPTTRHPLSGLGAARDVTSALAITAGLVSSPDATLRRHGPAVVTAVDRHVLGPLLGKVGEQLTPVVIKYVLPTVAGLYVLGGLSAYYSYQTAKSRRLKTNRRRRKRKRRTSR
jgi:hypothetical protein